MAMNVTSSTASATLRQAPSQKQTQQVASMTEEQRMASTQQKAKQLQQTQRTEQPKPVVNAQGQTTGKVINTTA